MYQAHTPSGLISAGSPLFLWSFPFRYHLYIPKLMAAGRSPPRCNSPRQYQNFPPSGQITAGKSLSRCNLPNCHHCCEPSGSITAGRSLAASRCRTPQNSYRIVYIIICLTVWRSMICGIYVTITRLTSLHSRNRVRNVYISAPSRSLWIICSLQSEGSSKRVIMEIVIGCVIFGIQTEN